METFLLKHFIRCMSHICVRSSFCIVFIPQEVMLHIHCSTATNLEKAPLILKKSNEMVRQARVNKLEACIRQRVVQSLCSREQERASWMKRGMSLILLTCRIDIYSPFRPLSLSQIPIRSVALAVILALHASNRSVVKITSHCQNSGQGKKVTCFFRSIPIHTWFSFFHYNSEL